MSLNPDSDDQFAIDVANNYQKENPYLDNMWED